MLRLIYFSAALIILSFIGVPVYNGIVKKHDEITKTASIEAPDDGSLSFEEIYEIADEGRNNNDAAFLNDITPAAGSENYSDDFSTGFRAKEDSALQDTPPTTTEPVVGENSF